MSISRTARLATLSLLTTTMVAGLGIGTAAADPGLNFGPDTCRQGYVWRDAFVGDHTCVHPAQRDQAAQDNARAHERIDHRGTHGSNSCIQGFVWREARRGDVVCVTPAVRDQTARDNAAGPGRRAAATEVSIGPTIVFPNEVRGHCDNDVARIGFSSTISGTPGQRIRYRWLRSDGNHTTYRVGTIPSSGRVHVTYSWTRGNGEGWAALEVVEPKRVAAPPAPFTIDCRDLRPDEY